MCKTKYPIVLIHGTGFRDWKYYGYWGRIPKVLQKEGCTVYFGHQDGVATVEQNALTLKENIEELISKTGCEKVNLIGHSKGGLEGRYLISSLAMSDYIASLTTIATPHHGSKVMNLMCNCPDIISKPGAFFTNLLFRILGDGHPDFYNVCKQFSTSYAKIFNDNNPDIEGVYYQSYASVMKNIFSDLFMLLPYSVVYLLEGENDGLVSPKSAEWTNFKGVLRGSTTRGISHSDVVDNWRMKFSRKNSPGYVNDICDIYIKIVSELKQNGF